MKYHIRDWDGGRTLIDKLELSYEKSYNKEQLHDILDKILKHNINVMIKNKTVYLFESDML